MRIVLTSTIATLVIAALGVPVGNGAEPPRAPKVSSFAPATDLIEEVDFFIKRIGQRLTDKDGYDKDQVASMRKDANTMIVLAQHLALHDERHALSAAAPALLAASRQLAQDHATYDAAKPAFDKLLKVVTSKQADPAAPKAEWKKVASLGALMKEVPFLDAQIKRAIRRESRFPRAAAQTAAHAAALAAIGQASIYDLHEVKDPADTAKWYQWCGEMRDAAGELNAAARDKDFKQATTAYKRLSQTCHDCHQVFRKEDP